MIISIIVFVHICTIRIHPYTFHSWDKIILCHIFWCYRRICRHVSLCIFYSIHICEIGDFKECAWIQLPKYIHPCWIYSRSNYHRKWFILFMPSILIVFNVTVEQRVNNMINRAQNLFKLSGYTLLRKNIASCNTQLITYEILDVTITLKDWTCIWLQMNLNSKLSISCVIDGKEWRQK